MNLRRVVSIVVGAGAALALAGTAGAAAWRFSTDGVRPVGSWQEAAGSTRTPVAVRQPAAATGGDASPGGTPAASPSSGKPEAKTSASAAGTANPTILPESGTAAGGDGRQKVGELLQIDKLLGYGAPEREVLHYPAASYVKVHFSRMMMLPGDYVTVSDPKGEESYRYDAPKLLDGVTDTDRWAMSITGDTAVVETHRAAGGELVGSLLGRLGVNVDKVARGFSRKEQARVPAESLTRPGSTGHEESVCGSDTSADAVCYRSADPVAYTRSKSIARLLINGTELCTGWRIGAKNRMLTNNHCFDNSAAAYETEVWFNYQCAKCGGFDVFKPTKVWGDKVLSTEHVLDYTLFTVGNFESVQKFGYLSLDTAVPAKGQELYVPQHPAGEPTRIAGRLGEPAGTCAVVDPAFDGYAQNSDVSYYCDTEGGSSGSPVLSRKTNRVVALHHFGGCPNSGVRADLLNNRIKSYL